MKKKYLLLAGGAGTIGLVITIVLIIIIITAIAIGSYFLIRKIKKDKDKHSPTNTKNEHREEILKHTSVRRNN